MAGFSYQGSSMLSMLSGIIRMLELAGALRYSWVGDLQLHRLVHSPEPVTLWPGLSGPVPQQGQTVILYRATSPNTL